MLVNSRNEGDAPKTLPRPGNGSPSLLHRPSSRRLGDCPTRLRSMQAMLVDERFNPVTTQYAAEHDYPAFHGFHSFNNQAPSAP